ncbi:MAG: FkbM family methyltransferase [Solirubrobacteraceae bacterium]|jgi:FkbM family methyltransferase
MRKRLEAALAAGRRQWSRGPLGAAARRRRRLEGGLPDTGLQIATLETGGKLICDLSVRYDRRVYLGREEVPELRLVSRLLGEGDVFVDCGANIGLFTVCAADAVGPTGRVFSCEPVASTFARLRENCAINDFGDRVCLVNNALGAESGIEVVLAGDVHNVMHVDARPGTAGQTVRTVTLDSILEGSPTVTGLKIDVEGYELEVLRGAEETFRRLSPWVLIEFNSEIVGTWELRSWDVDAFLAERGYRAYWPRAVLNGKRAPLPDSWVNPGQFLNLLYCRGEIPAA